ncbi:MAG: HEAT repeat domain-containing protein [Acaryochloridaceae cyanobacterium RU_4_10]|jgi:HEAT repeat protein|nr:HEAT repeat domain-containing protein [Acaryochloridaceae cyanobacterium RU_4_10]
MTQVDLTIIANQLESTNARDRLMALTALKSLPADNAVPLVQKVLYDEHLPVRSLAIFTLGENPNAACYDLLLNLLERDTDYAARADAAAALGALQDLRAFEPLVRAFFEDTSWLVQFSAVVSLGNLKDARANGVLRQALNSSESIIQMAAMSALGEIGDVESVPLLLEFIPSEDWLIRQRLSEALGNLPTPKSLAALKYLQKDSHPHVAEAATFALERLSMS